MKSKRLVVVGGGASGLFAAVNAARMTAGRLEVILLEKQQELLQKVKVSGGGRCNVTHTFQRTALFADQYARGRNFLKKTLQHFSPEDTRLWFESRGVALKTEQDGRIFPRSDTSASIIQCLLQEASTYQVQIRMKSEVIQITHQANKFSIILKQGEQIESDFLFIATGGYAKASQYDWLRTLPHTLVPPVPSLFTFQLPLSGLRALMGVSVSMVRLKLEGSHWMERGPLLLTHWGLSGPAVLKLSAWAARELHDKGYDFIVRINWLDEGEQELRTRWQGIRDKMGNQKLYSRNPFLLPQRLWIYLLEEEAIPEAQTWSNLPAKMQNRLIHQLTNYAAHVQGKTTFKEEFVTCGGISLDEVHAATMESRLWPGMYFGGEVLDVDGITGGFNFQHAWTSGYLAAAAIAAKVP